jgi:MFS family permease
MMIKKDGMFYRFAAYGFLKNLRFFEPFIILIFRANGLSYLQIGLLYSIRDLTNNLMEIPTGVLADTLGRRRAMVLAFISYIISFAIFYLFADFYSYSLAMVLFGLGEAFRSGTHKALILEYLDRQNMLDKKVSYYGRTRGASQLGSAFNSLIAAALLFSTGNYRSMFLAAIIPYLLDLLNLATYPKYLDGEMVVLKSDTLRERAKTTVSGFIGIFRDRQAMRAILNSASFTALFKTTKDYLQPILESFALALPLLVFLEDVKRSSVVIGIAYFCIYLLTSYASRNSDRASGRFDSLARAINITFLIGVGFLFVAGLTTWMKWVVISVLVFLGFYILQNVRKPMNVAFISDQISQQVMASGLSIEAQFTTILVAVSAPILGALADAYGVGLALALLGLGTLLLFSFVRVPEQEPEH